MGSYGQVGKTLRLSMSAVTGRVRGWGAGEAGRDQIGGGWGLTTVGGI